MTGTRSKNTESTSKLPLTARQREALEFIRRCVRRRGYGPTVREIGDHMGINSPNGVVGHLVALERKGFIHREANLSRSIMLVERGEKAARGLQVMANIQDGKFIEAGQEERVDLTEDLQLSGEDFFFVRMTDESLQHLNIHRDDMLLVRRARTAAKGEIALLRTEQNMLVPGRCVYDEAQGKTFIETLHAEQHLVENGCSAIYGVMVAVLRVMK